MIMAAEMLRSTQKKQRNENEVECDIDGLGCQRQIEFLPDGEVRDLEQTYVDPTEDISPATLAAIIIGCIIVVFGIAGLVTLLVVQWRKKKKKTPIKSRSLCVEEGIVYKEDAYSKHVDRNQSLETLPAPMTPPLLIKATETKTTSNGEGKKSKNKEKKQDSSHKKQEKNTPYNDINFSPGQMGCGTKLFTAFTEAAFFGQLEQLETFADLCGTTVDGAFARLPSNRASAQALSVLMTEIDGEGFTALHRAIQGSSTEVVRWLLKNKADPRVRSRNGETPLHIAVLHQNIQACEILLATEASKDIDTKDYRHGHTPLDIAKACEIGNIVELLQVASEML